MGVHPGLGILHAGVVDDGGQHVEGHEYHRGGEAGEQQGHDSGHNEDDVHPEQVGTQQGLLLLGELLLGISGGLESHGADALFLAGSQECGDNQHTYQAHQHGGKDGKEEGDGVIAHAQRGGGTDGGAAPGQDIHGAGGEGHNGGQRSAAHAERVIQRKQRGHTDQEGDRSGAVQMDDGSQNGGADADFDGIGAYQVQNALDDGAEGAGIGQDAKEQNGEDEHDAGGRHGADALGAGDHVAQGLEVGEKVHNTLRSLRGALRHDRDEEAGDDAGDHGNYDQSHQRRYFFGHNQYQHDDDRQESENC